MVFQESVPADLPVDHREGWRAYSRAHRNARRTDVRGQGGLRGEEGGRFLRGDGAVRRRKLRPHVCRRAGRRAHRRDGHEEDLRRTGLLSPDREARAAGDRRVHSAGGLQRQGPVVRLPQGRADHQRSLRGARAARGRGLEVQCGERFRREGGRPAEGRARQRQRRLRPCVHRPDGNLHQVSLLYAPDHGRRQILLCVHAAPELSGHSGEVRARQGRRHLVHRRAADLHLHRGGAARDARGGEARGRRLHRALGGLCGSRRQGRAE